MTICKADSCENDTSKGGKGYCGKHWIRLKRYGKLDTWKNIGSGFTISKQGYVLLNLINGKRQYEHTVLAEKALGHKLPKGAVVHHTGVPHDNHGFCKLVICPNQTYHLLLHRRAKELGYE